MAKKRSLGRGLDALLDSHRTARGSAEAAPEGGGGSLQELPVEWVERGRYQPRRDMDPEALEELASSIRAQGIMQPVVVRPVASQRYEIIAGERRWRAAQLAGLERIPVVVRDVDDESAIAMALIENIQREDLNPMEEAVAMARLQKEFELTHQQIADAVGKSRTTITNLLRLMTLREEVQRMLEHGDLEMGHARALLTLPEAQQVQAADTVVSRGLSVRQTEALARRLQEEARRPPREEPDKDPDIRQLEESLAQKLGAAVSIRHGRQGRGQVILKYNSLDELDGILSHIR